MNVLDGGLRNNTMKDFSCKVKINGISGGDGKAVYYCHRKGGRVGLFKNVWWVIGVWIYVHLCNITSPEIKEAAAAFKCLSKEIINLS